MSDRPHPASPKLAEEYGEHVAREAEAIVLRELDRLAARLRSDGQRFYREAPEKETVELIAFYKATADALVAASDLISRTRAVFAGRTPGEG